MTRLAIAVGIALILAFPIVYPIANRGLTGGSDRDEALNLAVRNLWAGRYLYEGRTYLGGPITPLPGAILLAAPFVALGNSAYQNPFWLAVLLAVLWHLAGRRGAIAFLFLVLNPLTLREFYTGGDLFANSAYVLIAVLWLLRAKDMRLPALFFGLALSSRALFWPLAISMLAYLLWNEKRAGKAALLSGAVFLFVTLPPYLEHPAGFTPLHTMGYAPPVAVIIGVLLLVSALALVTFDMPTVLAVSVLALGLPVATAIIHQRVWLWVLYALPAWVFAGAWFGLRFTASARSVSPRQGKFQAPG